HRDPRHPTSFPTRRSADLPEHEVTYLQLRLEQTRWSPTFENSGWTAGTDSDYLRALVEYWTTQYNWREREARLNRFNHFITEVGDRKSTRLNSSHVKSSYA